MCSYVFPLKTPKLANSQAVPAPTPHNYRAMRTERGQTLQALAPTSSQRRLNGLLHPAEPAPLPVQGWPIMGEFLHPLPTLLPSTCRSRLSQSVNQSIRQSNPANQPQPQPQKLRRWCQTGKGNATNPERKAEIRSGRLTRRARNVALAVVWLKFDFCLLSQPLHHIISKHRVIS